MKLTNPARELFEFFYTDLQGNADFTDLSLSDIKTVLNDIESNYIENYPIESFNNKNSDNSQHLELLRVCLEAVNCDFTDLSYDEFFECLEEIETKEAGDFWLESLPCGEVRIIDKEEIDQIWTDSLIEQIKDSYDLSDVPDFVAIDWEQTAQNCKVDGLGHHFAGYDHEEHSTNMYYVFRTN